MSRSQPHSRQASTDASSLASGSGASYQLILDHILTYPGSYEIPLRTMYTLNSAPRGQLHGHNSSSSTSSTASSAANSPMLPQGAWSGRQVAEAFNENLMAQISNLSHQPSSLPPSFIISFVRRCFSPELVEVDFPQALTGLDYLKDLEIRRRREVASAMARLAIDRNTLADKPESLADRPSIQQWVQSMEEKERKIDIHYTRVYIGIRRWIMINELSLLPFNKGNCVAMLNTLYPPIVGPQASTQVQPTSKLTPAHLKEQRDGFFKYINSVEKNGPRVLGNLMKQGNGPGEDNGWIAITRYLNLYLQLANSVIFQCADIVDIDDIISKSERDSTTSLTKSVRKADSGISFGSNNSDSRRPTSSGTSKEPAPTAEPQRPKTPTAMKSGSALEKLARGLRTIGRSRVDATEIITDNSTAAVERPKGLRKMRSMGSLDRGKSAAPRKADMPSFDAQEMRLQRMKYEAGLVAEQKFGARQKAHEV